jgi:hypothetical protein
MKSPSELVGAKITEEKLSAQNPANIPTDWDTPGERHPICVAIWEAWLDFVPVFLNEHTITGSVRHLIPPLLSWGKPHENLMITLSMRYMPTRLTTSVMGDLHPVSTERSN